MDSDVKEEKTPLLEDSKRTAEERTNDKVPTKSLALPLGIFLFSIASELKTSTSNQYVYNYTETANQLNQSAVLHLSTDNSNLICGKNSSTSQNDNQKEAANWLLYFSLIEHAIGLPVIVFAGIYSDFYGRKVFLLISYMGEGIRTAFMFFLIYFKFDIIYMLIPNGIYGLTGTAYTFYICANSLVADTTPSGKKRSFHMLLIYVFIGLGTFSAAIGCGYIINAYGFAIPMAMAFGTLFLGLIILFFQEETLPLEKRKTKPPLCATFARFFIFFRGRGYNEFGVRWKFSTAVLSVIFLLLALSGLGKIETLYMLRDPFCFSSQMVGYFSGATNIAHLILGSLLVKTMHLCVNDEIITIIGLMSGVTYLIVLAFSFAGWMIFLASGLGILAIVPLSIMRSILSKMVSADYQGALFALVYFLEASCSIAGNTLFLTIYGQTQSIMHGFAFIVMAGFYLVAATLMM
ncbi:hypothetical protein FSP39_015051 [Pinctada imbricata]|uniref:Proton-coupled folate transporter n=1 Tax=Pinctada imbricata TaxID=66713 RepID=A0AA88YMU0_PINIB|nr:hypothetical protein FSP39_015051 [Pinctada imbricata]